MTRDRLNELRQETQRYIRVSFFGDTATVISRGQDMDLYMDAKEFMELLDIVQEKFDIDDQSRYGMNR